MNFFEWSRSDPPALLVDLREPGSLDWLLDRYGGSNPTVLESVLAQVFQLGAQMAVVEYRYIDADYRDEHSRFYSKAFRRYPSVGHRLHFFSNAPPEEMESELQPVNLEGLDYLGFAVLRPVPGAPVGRTMIRPPRDLAAYIACVADDSANLFGTRLTVTGCPFIAQDAQLSVCAHATLWVIAHYHHLRYSRPRLLPGEIAEAVPSELGLGRPTPSIGLSIFQIAETATRIGLPALVYSLDRLPDGESLFRIVCRYLNSAMPVIVAGGGHAFTLIGYRRTHAATGEERIHFIRHDDESGPYQVVENPYLDDYSPWEYVIVPLPQKAYLSGETAEVVGSEMLQFSIRNSPAEAGQALSQELDDPVHSLSFRSTLLLSNKFKSGLGDRLMPAELTAMYQRLPLSRWVWVVELTRRQERDAGEPCVVAEAVLDATDHLRDLRVLAWRIPGQFFAWSPDEDVVQVADGLDPAPLIRSAAHGSSEVV